MVKESSVREYVSPERKGILASIRDRIDVAEVSKRKGNYDAAKRYYSDAAARYESIGDSKHAEEYRGLAEKIGNRNSIFKRESPSRVFYLGSGLASAVSVFAIALGSLIVLPKITGNAIGNANIGMSLAGVFIFIAGVLGLYSSLRRDEQ